MLEKQTLLIYSDTLLLQCCMPYLANPNPWYGNGNGNDNDNGNGNGNGKGKGNGNETILKTNK